MDGWTDRWKERVSKRQGRKGDKNITSWPERWLCGKGRWPQKYEGQSSAPLQALLGQLGVAIHPCIFREPEIGGQLGLAGCQPVAGIVNR